MKQKLINILLLICCSSLCLSVNAQSSIKGTIIGRDTKLPISGAYVYLDNTSFGTTTNEKGEFVLTRIATGRYDLVVSYVGYEKWKKSIVLNDPILLGDVLIAPKVNELQEVIVRPFEKDGWDKYGDIFRDNFIGTSEFAGECRIINTDVIKFFFNRKTNIVSASADEPLLIENLALGYRIKYELSTFEFDLTTKAFVYGGNAFFESLPATKPSLAKKWRQNRQEAYQGSIMHFMRSLYKDNLTAEKFEVYNITTVTADEKHRIDSISKTLKSLRPDIVTVVGEKGATKVQSSDGYKDTLAYYRQVKAASVGSDIRSNNPLNSKEFFFRKDKDIMMLGNTDRLFVVFLPKQDYPGFQKYLARYKTNQQVGSWIIPLRQVPIAVYKEGMFFDGNNVKFTGFWSWWEKLCNKLPYDFQPD